MHSNLKNAVILNLTINAITTFKTTNNNVFAYLIQNYIVTMIKLIWYILDYNGEFLSDNNYYQSRRSMSRYNVYNV